MEKEQVLWWLFDEGDGNPPFFDKAEKDGPPVL
jgi:hypothetical protein